jgi:stage II sporulation protein D
VIDVSFYKIATVIICCFFFNCTNRFLTSNPHSDNSISSSEKNTVNNSYVYNVKKTDDLDDLDFGTTLDSVSTSDTTAIKTVATDYPNQIASIRNPPFLVDRSYVRVALKQNVTRVTFYSIGNVELHPSKGTVKVFRGRCFALLDEKAHLEMESSWGKIKFQLPCTLISKNEYNFIDLEQQSYRGAIVLFSEKKNSFSIVNSLEVEEYLRGVVPLEIGKLKNDGLEALKAQAVAARTYTYQRISQQLGCSYDLYPTTADQVYGGANVEYRESDLAVRLTKNLIMVYNNSVATAYYHSTCGGTTANIEDVWKNKPALAYLRSESDRDSLGNAYCTRSKYFKWEEFWTKDQLSLNVNQGIKAIQPKSLFRGPIRDLHIGATFVCGRVRECTITGLNWKYNCGGDIIRTIFRRPVAGNPILRSSNFVIAENNSKGVKITGSGFGHGVGMCQTGAIYRAQNGQKFETILGAYYRGIVICSAVFSQ